MTPIRELVNTMADQLSRMASAMRNHYRDTPQWNECDEEAMTEADALVEQAQFVLNEGVNAPVELLTETVIGFCEGRAAPDDIAMVRDALRITGMADKGIDRVMLGMRGMYVPGHEASAAAVAQHVAHPTPRDRMCKDEGCPHHGTPHVCVNNLEITVKADDLRKLLNACTGMPYEIRELQATRLTHKADGSKPNALQSLIDQYNDWLTPVPTPEIKS